MAATNNNRDQEYAAQIKAWLVYEDKRLADIFRTQDYSLLKMPVSTYNMTKFVVDKINENMIYKGDMTRTIIKNVFEAAMKLFFSNCVRPFYLIFHMVKRSRGYVLPPTDHPFYPIFIKLDECIVQQWRMELTDNRCGQFFFTMKNIHTFIKWVFGLSYDVPVSRERDKGYYRRLDDKYAKDKNIPLTIWGTDTAMAIESVISNYHAGHQQAAVSRAQKRAAKRLETVSFQSSISTPIHVAVAASVGTIFDGKMEAFLMAVDEMIVCVTTYWYFVFDRVSAIVRERDHPRVTISNMFAPLKGGLLNDMLLSMENDKIKNIIDVYGHDKAKFEAMVCAIGDDFTEDVTYLNGLFKDAIEKHLKAVSHDDMAKLKESVDAFIAIYDRFSSII